MKRSEIKQWFEAGVKNNKTHLIVVCDTFEEPNSDPVYVDQGQNPVETAEDYGYDPDDPYAERDMQRVMEVYNLNMSWEEQDTTETEPLQVPKLLKGGIGDALGDVVDDLQVPKRVINF